MLTPVAEALDRALALPDETVPDRERDVIGPLTSDAPGPDSATPVHRGAVAACCRSGSDRRLQRSLSRVAT